MESELRGKTALVTGASRGIGRAIALKFASLGVRVAVNYHTSRQLAEEVCQRIQASGCEALAVHADVRNRAQTEAMVDQVTKAWDRIDILVNNAGIIKDTLLLRMSEEDWDEVLNVNLKGAYLCSKAVLRSMVRHRWGRIINIASIIGMLGNPGQSNYAASKAGLIGFTKSIAKEVASRNITVNAIAPGFIDTEIVSVLSVERRKQMLDMIPMQRFGVPEDVAEMAAFLATDRASYITGQVICIDGGMGM